MRFVQGGRNAPRVPAVFAANLLPKALFVAKRKVRATNLNIARGKQEIVHVTSFFQTELCVLVEEGSVIKEFALNGSNVTE